MHDVVVVRRRSGRARRRARRGPRRAGRRGVREAAGRDRQGLRRGPDARRAARAAGARRRPARVDRSSGITYRHRRTSVARGRLPARPRTRRATDGAARGACAMRPRSAAGVADPARPGRRGRADTASTSARRCAGALPGRRRRAALRGARRARPGPRADTRMRRAGGCAGTSRCAPTTRHGRRHLGRALRGLRDPGGCRHRSGSPSSPAARGGFAEQLAAFPALADRLRGQHAVVDQPRRRPAAATVARPRARPGAAGRRRRRLHRRADR